MNRHEMQKETMMNNQQVPLVTIIIRTFDRIDVLKNAIDSVLCQTYPNIEIVVVEDGKSTAKTMIQTEYEKANIFYYCEEKKVGRTHIGNIGLEKAKGKYINFLDDDDILYPNHIEILVNEIEKGSGLVAYSIAHESHITIKSRYPYKFREDRVIIRYNQPFNRLLLAYDNYLPIQSVLFARKLYEENDGFDEQLDVLEDWDLWVRYATKTDFVYVPHVTSKYYVINSRRKKSARLTDLHKSREHIIKKFDNYNVQMSIGQIDREMKYIIEDFNTGKVFRFIRNLGRFLLFGDK